MPPIPDHINIGEILLDRLCCHAKIEDWKNIGSDNKSNLIKFINATTDNKCDFEVKSLERIIDAVKAGELKNEIPLSRPTCHTLCFVVYKCEKPDAKLQTRLYQNKTHANSHFVKHFIDKIVLPLVAVSDKSYLPEDGPDVFNNSCWYVYMNLFDDKENRSIGRRVLHVKNESGKITTEYSRKDIANPDWEGEAPRYDSSNGFLYFDFQTKKNKDRKLVIMLRIGHKKIPAIIHGRMTHTKADYVLDHPIVLTKVDCSIKPKPKKIKEGTDMTILSIDEYLKQQQKTTLRYKIPLHNCGNEINGIK